MAAARRAPCAAWQGKNAPGVLDLSPETFNATVKRSAAEGNNVVWVVEFYSDR